MSGASGVRTGGSAPQRSAKRSSAAAHRRPLQASNNENSAGDNAQSAAMAQDSATGSAVAGLEQLLQTCSLEDCCDEILTKMFQQFGVAKTNEHVDRVAKRFKGLSMGPDSAGAQIGSAQCIWAC
jgi:hypothetical protein